MILHRLLSRWRRGDEDRAEDGQLRAVEDGAPRDGLFTQPLAVTVTASDPEARGRDRWLVRFQVEVRDDEGRRCPQLAVGARMEGPRRSGNGEAHTDLLGRARFQREGPAGRYRLQLLHVAGDALELDRPLEELTAETRVPGR